MDLIAKEWPDIAGFTDYTISKRGRIYSKRSKKIIKPFLHKQGYLRVLIYNSKRLRKHALVHRLLLMTYKPIDEYKECNHKDGDKANNKLSNLEWCTPSENCSHAHKRGLIKYNAARGERSPKSKITETDVIEIRNMYDLGFKISKIAKIKKISYSIAYKVAKRERWAHVV